MIKETILTVVWSVFGIGYLTKNYELILQKLERLIARNKTLEEVDLEILTKYSRFYKGLSPHMKYVFEERLALFMFSRSFEGIGLEITSKMKVLISAYAAQLTFGIHNFEFKNFKKIKLYGGPFSITEGVFQSWLIEAENDTIHVSWPDFYTEIRIKRKNVPLGLEIMARLLQIENKSQKIISLKTDKTGHLEYFNVNLYQQIVMDSDFQLFTKTDLLSLDNFIKACILYYHSDPVKMKNCYPRLYEEINKAVFTEFAEVA